MGRLRVVLAMPSGHFSWSPVGGHDHLRCMERYWKSEKKEKGGRKDPSSCPGAPEAFDRPERLLICPLEYLITRMPSGVFHLARRLEVERKRAQINAVHNIEAPSTRGNPRLDSQSVL